MPQSSRNAKSRLHVLAIPRDGLPPLCPVLMEGGGEAVLVDTACTGQLPQIEAAARQAGVDLNRLTLVFLTHHDHDHVGALAALLRAHPQARALASALEAPHVDGRAKSLRLERELAAFADLPEDKKPEARRRLDMLNAVEPARIDRELVGGEFFPVCGGLEVIATPGHMPGHISIYHRESRTLISGDALTAQDGRLCGPNPLYTLDMAQARASLERLLGYDIAAVVCHHGGRVAGNIRRALRAILAA